MMRSDMGFWSLWGPLGSSFGGFGETLGGSWGLLGPLGETLESSWGALWVLLGTLWSGTVLANLLKEVRFWVLPKTATRFANMFSLFFDNLKVNLEVIFELLSGITI